MHATVVGPQCWLRRVEACVALACGYVREAPTGGSKIRLSGMVPTTEDLMIELSMAELREITGYAVACAKPALAIFEKEHPDDRRPRVAIDAAQAFANGAERTKAIRDTAWAAHRAYQEARDTGRAAASEAARAAVAAASAAYLHPLAKATQVLHILGPAAHAALAFELETAGDRNVGSDYIAKARDMACQTVPRVLIRYPKAPSGRGRAGELVRELDASLRQLAPITDRSPSAQGDLPS